MNTERLPFTVNDQQKQWLARLDVVLEAVKEETKRVDEENGFNYKLIEELKCNGYHKLPVPASYGGGQASLTDLLLYQERIARSDAPIALAIGWHMITVSQLSITNQWEPGVLAHLYRDIVEHGALINRADSEAATGSPSRGGIPQTRAKKTAGGYVLTGRKTFTSLAPVLDYFIVSAYYEEAGMICDFLVPKGTIGISIDPTWNMVGMKGTGSHDLVIQEAYLPDEAKVSERLPSAARGMHPNPYMMSIPACYLGIAGAARNEALRFAKHYQPNSLDQPIAYLPHIQQLIGQIELELSAARHYMYAIAARWEHEGERAAYGNADIGAVKTFAIQTALSVVDKSMRIVGAHSLAMSHPLQRMYRDVRFGLHNPPMDDATLRNLAVRAIEEG